jgi:hypothetical protein
MYLNRAGSLQLVYHDTHVAVYYNGPFLPGALGMLAAWERGRPHAQPAAITGPRRMQEHIARRTAALHGRGGLVS